MANKYTKIKIDIERVISLYGSGMTQDEVAEELGTTQKVIWQRLKGIGYKCRVAAKRNQRGEDNDSWKGGEASYSAFHLRTQALRGKPQKCEVCGTTDPKRGYDWASMSGRYDDPYDYKRMCRSCHWKQDKKIFNIKHMRKESV